MTETVTNAKLESSLEEFFYRRVRLVGGLPVKMIPNQAGMPDRIVFMPGGRFYLVELKKADGTVSKIQEVWHSRMEERFGIPVYVVYGRQGVLDWIRAVVGYTDPKSKRTSGPAKP